MKYIRRNYASYINQFVDIAKHCQQLETIHFNGFNITEEMASHIMTQLAIKRLIFKQCRITEEVAQVFVQALKNSDHSFCDIKLFETNFFRWNYCWTMSDYEKAWKKASRMKLTCLHGATSFERTETHFLQKYLVMQVWTTG